MWMAIICKCNTFLYFWPTSAGEIYKNGRVFVYSSVYYHERNYQFFLLICSLYCQHQKVSLQTVVCCLYILYVHGCVNSGNLFSTLLFCQYQQVNLFFWCVHVDADASVIYFSFCLLLYQHQLVRFSWFCVLNCTWIHEQSYNFLSSSTHSIANIRRWFCCLVLFLHGCVGNCS